MENLNKLNLTELTNALSNAPNESTKNLITNRMMVLKDRHRKKTINKKTKEESSDSSSTVKSDVSINTLYKAVEIPFEEPLPTTNQENTRAIRMAHATKLLTEYKRPSKSAPKKRVSPKEIDVSKSITTTKLEEQYPHIFKHINTVYDMDVEKDYDIVSITFNLQRKKTLV
jgi:hypothetical protein